MDSRYNFEGNKFIITNYNYAKTFASFLPGIAGKLGLPLWSFYVNRGQGICSFGVSNKHNPILEFFPADQAYQNVSTNGFRTFIKTNNVTYEPFKQTTPYPHEMEISYEKLELVEENTDLGIVIRVSYITMANQNFPALIRKVEIENVSGSDLHIELLDGLPRVSPYGVNTFSTKMMSYTSQAWMEVNNIENNLPFFKIKAGMDDTQTVSEVKAGNFYLCCDKNGRLSTVVDPVIIFGNDRSIISPFEFEKSSLANLLQMNQVRFNKIPCAFFGKSLTIPVGDTFTYFGVIGHIASMGFLNKVISKLSFQNIDNQFQLNKQIVDGLASSFKVVTSDEKFDNYVKYCFLDNILRGGYPLAVSTNYQKLPVVYHVFFRKHGDLERDYNDFYLAPEFYSQGNGNYRDINQNRRLDVSIDPNVSYYNIMVFMNLLQVDGYNPLVLTGTSFIYNNPPASLEKYIVEGSKIIFEVVNKEFTPGSLLRSIREHDIQLKLPEEETIEGILADSRQLQKSSHGEGYWVDHFGYNLDLIENYLSVFPDREFELLFETNEFTYHDSEVVVMPLSKRLSYENGIVIQRNSTSVCEEKAALINSRNSEPNIVRVGDQIYRTNLFNKLLSLILIKFTTMDPAGYGIEMEAGKPGWYDALNGLPGLFGSSTTETYVLKQFVEYLAKVTDNYDMKTILVPNEIHELADAISSNLETDDVSVYWAENVKSRETFREQTKYGFSGLIEMEWVKIRCLISKINAKLERSIVEMIAFSNGKLPTYFYFKLVNPEEFVRNDQFAISQENYHRLNFEIKPFPLFLEGFAKGINVSRINKSEIYNRVLESALYDDTLKMFRVNENLNTMSYKIGRAHSFVRGWLENESIWMHMQYKFLLSLLKAGLFTEFYGHLKEIFIPFLKPEKYGRSTLENSSFIVSSSFPDPELHGRGYYARLSGATVEALSIITIMFIGTNSYQMVEDDLTIQFKPTIPGWLFTDDNMVKFTLHSNTILTYYNHKKMDTHLLNPKSIEIDGLKIDGSVIPEPHSIDIRDRKIQNIDIVLG